MSKTDRTFDLIELLARRGAIGMRPLARELDVPVGSLHRLLADLESQSVVERTRDGQWQLSYRILNIAGIQMDRISLPALVRPTLEQLAVETGETVFLAVQSHHDVVYLDKVQGRMQLQLNVELGARRPIYATGLGKAIIAFRPEDERDRYLREGEFTAFTLHTIVDPLHLRNVLDDIRGNGYASDAEEIITGLHCLAVPILDHTGRSVAAISIAGTSPRSDSERFPALVTRMKAAGRDLSLRLGYLPIRDVQPESPGNHDRSHSS